MAAVANASFPVFGLILIGFVCGRRALFGAEAVNVLNGFVVWLALPALLFQAMAQISWDAVDQPGFIGAFAGGIALTFLVSLVLDRPRQRLADASIEALDAAYANVGFMGIPLCLIVFGEASLPAAIIATLLTACALFAVAIILIEIDAHKDADLRRALAKIGLSLVRNPLLIGPAAGLAVAAAHITLPAPLARLTTLLGGAASPCALVTIGLFLAVERSGRDVRRVGRLVGLKLVLQPAVTGLLAYEVFGMPPLWSQAALLLSALPIGTGPFMLAKAYRRDATVTSGAILVSTILSVLTISLLVAWIGRH
jgi:malonate transporter